jgi:hypothetical protein
MTESRTRLLELIEELRREAEKLDSATQAGGAGTADSEEAKALRENTERYWRERAEELLDSLNPDARHLDESSDEPLLERGGPESDGLAVMVGHSRRSLGVSALSPPFPPALEAEEYHWNSELALQIKALADKHGIRCKIFYRDGHDIPGAYEVVKAWGPRASIELHFNCDGPGTQGTETWYGHGSSIPWAAKLQSRIVRLYGRKGGSDRGTKDARTTAPHRALTSTTQVQPSALIEPFFGSSLDDCEMAVARKPALARAIIEAYAELAGIDLPGDGPAAAPAAPTPQPVPASPPPPPPAAAANPSSPLPGLPESPLIARLRHLYLGAETQIAYPGLKIVTLAQWALESSWGTSGLAQEHFNFGGMKGIAEISHLSDIATVVQYQAHDGWDRYLRFASLQNFITGYWRFLERSPYRGWKEHAGRDRDFISFIARKWAPSDAQYTTKILDIADRIRRSLAQATAETIASGTTTVPAGPTGGTQSAGARLSDAAIPADGLEFRKLFDLVTSDSFEHRALQGAVLAQCALESNWGRSELARTHYNFAGIEWTDRLADLSVAVDYRRGDGTVGKYCRFLEHATFIKGYFARLDRDPRFAGWKTKANDPKAFIQHIGPVWRPNDASYVAGVLGIMGRLTPAGTPATSTPSSGQSSGAQAGTVTIPPGQVPDGYVIRIRRQRTERRRGGGVRTVGNYDVFFRGQKVGGLEGMVLETYGPGDNTATGTAYHRRVEARTYPLGTHSSDGSVPKYATQGYTSSTTPFAKTRPAIRLDKTGYRGGILMHPGGGFLASIGCLNLSRPLSGPNDNIDYVDSRARVIAIIEDMRAKLGSAFPSRSWKTIPNAWMMIEGEPADERTRSAPIENVELEAGVARDDPSQLYEIAAAAMSGSGADGADRARIQALIAGGADLNSLRSDAGENLWSAWADGIAAAALIADPGEQTRFTRDLGSIAALLKQSGVAIDESGALHTALVRAAIGNQGAAVKALIAQGATVDAPDRLGLSPLIAAAFFGAADAVDSLLAQGASPGATAKAAVQPAEAALEVYAELPPDGASALAAAEYGRSIVLYEPARDAAFEHIVAALTRG